MTTVPAPPGWYSGQTQIQYHWDGKQWLPLQLSSSERTTRLDAVIIEAVRYGGRVESRSATQAVIVWGNTTSGGVHVIHFLMTMFTCGFWLLVWIPVAMFTRQKRVTITVDPYGNVV